MYPITDKEMSRYSQYYGITILVHHQCSTLQLQILSFTVPLPRRRIRSVPLKSKTPESPTEENEYHTLQAFLGLEGSADSGVGASGTSSGDGEFTDVKKYAKQPFPSTHSESVRGTVHFQQNCIIRGIYYAVNIILN